jgi:hypothetical protein
MWDQLGSPWNRPSKPELLEAVAVSSIRGAGLRWCRLIESDTGRAKATICVCTASRDSARLGPCVGVTGSSESRR